MKSIGLLFFLICCSLMVSSQSDTIKWTELSPMPDANQLNGSGYFLIDSDFFVAGGWLGGSANTSSSVWRYHIPTDTWTQMVNLPFGAAGTTSSFVLNGYGYFLTARDSMKNGNCDNMFWQYDPTGDTWTRKVDFPDSPRQGNTVFSYNGKGYVGETLGCSDVDNHFWQYDPAINQWTQIATLPGPILARSSSISVYNAMAYLFGGLDPNAVFYNTIWKYNISQDSWQRIGQMPGLGRELSIVWGLDSILLIGGGVMVDTNSNIYLAHDFYKYNYYQNSWSSVVFQNSFDSAAYGASFVYNKKGYYFGGTNSYSQFSFSNKMWSFDASKYIHDTTTGIVNINPDVSFTVYPNPSHSPSFSISTSESGDIIFSDALGRVINETRLKQGVNQIRLTTDDQIIFYHATLQYGATANGKVVFLR